ncbi:MAG: hypothetical protein MRJ68_11330 [Nitrospira sp.]|nr:hypothetical protein [Nitrospira sp.]
MRSYDHVKDELERLSCGEDQLVDYDRLIRQQHEQAAELAAQLSQKRKEAAKRFTKMVGKELEALRMGSVQFVVQVMQSGLDDEYGPDGRIVSSFFWPRMPGNR